MNLSRSDRRSVVYAEIYAVVCEIPRGRVATYGQVAGFVHHCTARMVGYAMAALPADLDVPWQRVINSRGEVSPRRSGSGHLKQRRLLESEGIVFDERGRIDLDEFGWQV